MLTRLDGRVNTEALYCQQYNDQTVQAAPCQDYELGSLVPDGTPQVRLKLILYPPTNVCAL